MHFEIVVPSQRNSAFNRSFLTRSFGLGVAPSSHRCTGSSVTLWVTLTLEAGVVNRVGEVETLTRCSVELPTALWMEQNQSD